MKILLISNMYPSADNPAFGVFVRSFVEKLSARGILIDEVVISGRGRSLKEKLLKYANFYWLATRFLLRGDYDLVYVHGVGLSLLPLLWTRISKPLVVNAHGSDVLPSSFFGRLVRGGIARIVREADLVVVPSEFFAREVSEQLSVARERLFVSASGGVNRDVFRPPFSRGHSHSLTFGYVSRIDKKKGWDVLLNAALLLEREEVTGFNVLVVGGGSQLEELKGLVEKYGLNDRVRVIGAVPHDDLPEYFHQMDVFVFPSMLNESLGLAGLEAMACGVPVIGSDIGGLRGYIHPSENGYLFAPGDYVDLAGKMRAFIDLNVSEKERYSAGALSTASGYCSKVVAESLIEKLGEVIGSAKALH